MKKILSVIFFYLLFSNISFAKILDVGTHKLEVPSNFYLINWSDTNYGKNIEDIKILN